MKFLFLILLVISLGLKLSGQDSLKTELSKVAIYSDSVVTKIDKKKFVNEHGGVANCEKLNSDLTAIFKDYFKSINGAINLHLLSFKELDNNVVILICLVEGKYSPNLKMFWFDKHLNFKGDLLLEKMFVDAGQYEQYFTSDFLNSGFTITFISKWEEFDGKDYENFTETINTSYSFWGSTGGIQQSTPSKVRKKD